MMQQSSSGTYVAFGGSGGMGGMGGSGSNLVTAGQTITITDASSNTVFTTKSAAPRTASYVLFASPSISSGTNCTLNGSTIATAGSSSGGIMGPGMNGNEGQMPSEMGGESQMPGDMGGDPGQFSGFNGEQGQTPGGMNEQGQMPGGFPGQNNGNSCEIPTPPDGSSNGQQQMPPEMNADDTPPAMPGTDDSQALPDSQTNGNLPMPPAAQENGGNTQQAKPDTNAETEDAGNENGGWLQSLINWIIAFFTSIFCK